LSFQYLVLEDITIHMTSDMSYQSLNTKHETPNTKHQTHDEVDFIRIHL